MEQAIAAQLASAANSGAAALLHAAAAAAVATVPASVGAPAWNGKPLPCVPLTVGHQCVGAVSHPVSAVDFALAEEADAALGARASAFPELYAARVGHSSDIEYGKCFRAYMSLQCASAFPACTVLQADETNVLGRGRAPLCFSHCLDTLVSCPGFWVDDLDGACLDVAAEPSCSSASYKRAAPKQYATLDETLAANVA
mmetsp:Transcript_40524/g.91193  ORF Transcript_40524/g.91193 Transcript_40524/m.91193 type:complete len:199 (+) Transcript_40524:252-848(+)